VKTRVKAHERQNPHGGTEHVREHEREVPGSSNTSMTSTNFENEDQREKEEEDKDSDDGYDYTATVEGTMSNKGRIEDEKVTKFEVRPKGE
jgi:hypothetical protein